MPPRLSPIAELHARYDGRIPADELARAEAAMPAWRAEREAHRVARVRLNVRLHDETVVAGMATRIVAAHLSNGGQVTRDDLLARGCTEDQVRRFWEAAKTRAQPALRGGLEPGEMAA